MTGQTYIRLTPVARQWESMTLDLLGDAQLASQGGTAWAVVNRPRRKAITEFADVALMQMTLPLMFDWADINVSIEPLCAVLDSWRYPVPGTKQPPVLDLTGPVPRPWGNPVWVIQTIAWKSAIRRRSDGERTQQTVDVTLLEYQAANVAITYYSPAVAAQERAVAAPDIPPPAHRVYVVRAGDTLWAIAGQQLGNYLRWPEIANLNNIRDPRTLQIGVVLLLP